MCFHVSDRVESTLVWPQDGNVFALYPHKKVAMTFYKTDLKYAICCPFDEKHGQKYCRASGRCERRHNVQRSDHLVSTQVYLLKCGSSASEYEKYVSHE